MSDDSYECRVNVDANFAPPKSGPLSEYAEAEREDALTPKVEVLGIDQMQHFNAYIGALHKHLDANKAKSREREAKEAAEKLYEKRDTVYMRVVRRVDPVRMETAYYGHSVGGMPDPSMSIEIHMSDLADLLHECKFLFAEALFKAKVEPTWDAARLRASRCTVELADLVEA